MWQGTVSPTPGKGTTARRGTWVLGAPSALMQQDQRSHHRHLSEHAIHVAPYTAFNLLSQDHSRSPVSHTHLSSPPMPTIKSPPPPPPPLSSSFHSRYSSQVPPLRVLPRVNNGRLPPLDNYRYSSSGSRALVAPAISSQWKEDGYEEDSDANYIENTIYTSESSKDFPPSRSTQQIPAASSSYRPRRMSAPENSNIAEMPVIPRLTVSSVEEDSNELPSSHAWQEEQQQHPRLVQPRSVQVLPASASLGMRNENLDESLLWALADQRTAPAHHTPQFQFAFSNGESSTDGDGASTPPPPFTPPRSFRAPPLQLQSNFRGSHGDASASSSHERRSFVDHHTQGRQFHSVGRQSKPVLPQYSQLRILPSTLPTSILSPLLSELDFSDGILWPPFSPYIPVYELLVSSNLEKVFFYPKCADHNFEPLVNFRSPLCPFMLEDEHENFEMDGHGSIADIVGKSEDHKGVKDYHKSSASQKGQQSTAVGETDRAWKAMITFKPRSQSRSVQGTLQCSSGAPSYVIHIRRVCAGRYPEHQHHLASNRELETEAEGVSSFANISVSSERGPSSSNDCELCLADRAPVTILEPASQVPFIKLYEAREDYIARHMHELSFRAGDIIAVRLQCNSGQWWFGNVIYTREVEEISSAAFGKPTNGEERERAGQRAEKRKGTVPGITYSNNTDSSSTLPIDRRVHTAGWFPHIYVSSVSASVVLNNQEGNMVNQINLERSAPLTQGRLSDCNKPGQPEEGFEQRLHKDGKKQQDMGEYDDGKIRAHPGISISQKFPASSTNKAVRTRLVMLATATDSFHANSDTPMWSFHNPFVVVHQHQRGNSSDAKDYLSSTSFAGTTNINTDIKPFAFARGDHIIVTCLSPRLDFAYGVVVSIDYTAMEVSPRGAHSWFPASFITLSCSALVECRLINSPLSDEAFKAAWGSNNPLLYPASKSLFRHLWQAGQVDRNALKLEGGRLIQLEKLGENWKRTTAAFEIATTALWAQTVGLEITEAINARKLLESEAEERSGHLEHHSDHTQGQLQLQRQHQGQYEELAPLVGTTHLSHTRLFTFTMIAVQLLMLIIALGKGGVHGSENPMLGPSFSTLKSLGGRWVVDIRMGRIYLLFTPLFVPVGIVRFVLDALLLLILGWEIEHEYGSLRTAFVFITAGILSHITGAIFVPSWLIMGCGGALFGLLGALFWTHLRGFIIFPHPRASMATPISTTALYRNDTDLLKHNPSLFHKGRWSGSNKIGDSSLLTNKTSFQKSGSAFTLFNRRSTSSPRNSVTVRRAPPHFITEDATTMGTCTERAAQTPTTADSSTHPTDPELQTYGHSRFNRISLWRMISISVLVLIALLFGAFPGCDNWTQVGGLVPGFLAAIVADRSRVQSVLQKRDLSLLQVVAFALLASLVLISVIILTYVTDLTQPCQWCMRATCFDTRDWCDASSRLGS